MTPVIVGVAESELGVTNKSIPELSTQAALAALGEAGLSLDDVDGLFTNGVGRFSTILMSEYWGIVPTLTDSTFSGGATYEMFVARAAEAVRAGLCEVALVVYGSNQRSAMSRKLGGASDPNEPASQFDVPFGPLLPMSPYALSAQRHMHDFGTTPEQLASVAVAARDWARLNPAAYRYESDPLTVDDVLTSKMISSPLHGLDCCLVTDGGAAVVITSEERANSLELAHRPVQILGHGEATTHQSAAEMPDLTMTGAQTSSRLAFERAGLTPSDVDVAQIYDSFTITVLLTLEALGFCEPGESGAFVESGACSPGGSFPMNTSGGGLSYCHPGQFGLFLVVEAVRQLQRRGGDRQVSNPEIALCHGTGGMLSTHATVLLGIG